MSSAVQGQQGQQTCAQGRCAEEIDPLQLETSQQCIGQQGATGAADIACRRQGTHVQPPAPVRVEFEPTASQPRPARPDSSETFDQAPDLLGGHPNLILQHAPVLTGTALAAIMNSQRHGGLTPDEQCAQRTISRRTVESLRPD